MFFALNLVFLTNNNASTSSCCIVVFCLSLCCYENKNYFTVEPQGAVMGKGLGRLRGLTCLKQTLVWSEWAGLPIWALETSGA